MPVFTPGAPRLALALAASAVAAGCAQFDTANTRLIGLVTPYRVEVVQGNFVSREQVAALQPGMTRQQVRDILGTPLVTSVFHEERWDYVFTLRRQGVPQQERKVTVFFKGDAFQRHEGDELPSEADFVATLDNKRVGAKVPLLEASEERLKQFSASRPAPAPAAAVEPPPPASYPPLESPAR